MQARGGGGGWVGEERGGAFPQTQHLRKRGFILKGLGAFVAN